MLDFIPYLLILTLLPAPVLLVAAAYLASASPQNVVIDVWRRSCLLVLYILLIPLILALAIVEFFILAWDTGFWWALERIEDELRSTFENCVEEVFE